MSDESQKLIISFGKILKQKRIEAGISQEQLAFNIKSHPTHISRLENGHKQPTLSMIFKLCNELKVRPSVLISELEKLNYL